MIFIENLSIEFSKLSNFSLSWISLFLKSLYKESYVLEIVDTSSLDSEIDSNDNREIKTGIDF